MTPIQTAARAIATAHGLDPDDVTELPGGVANHVFRLGSTLILRIPRSAAFIADLQKEAAVIPVARTAGVRTPAIAAQGTITLDSIPTPYVLMDRVQGHDLADQPHIPANQVQGHDLADQPDAPKDRVHDHHPADQPQTPTNRAHDHHPVNRPDAPRDRVHDHGPSDHPHAPTNEVHDHHSADQPHTPTNRAHDHDLVARPVAPTDRVHDHHPADQPHTPTNRVHDHHLVARPVAPADRVHDHGLADQPHTPTNQVHHHEPADQPHTPTNRVDGRFPVDRPYAPAARLDPGFWADLGREIALLHQVRREHGRAVLDRRPGASRGSAGFSSPDAFADPLPGGRADVFAEPFTGGRADASAGGLTGALADGLSGVPEDSGTGRGSANELVERGYLDAGTGRWLGAWMDGLRGRFDERSPNVLLHGDLAPQNLMVDEAGRFVALVDWGDAAWGPRGMEFAKLRLEDVARVLPAYREVADVRFETGELEAAVLWFHLQWGLSNLTGPPRTGQRHWTATPGSRVLGVLRFLASDPPEPWDGLIKKVDLWV